MENLGIQPISLLLQSINFLLLLLILKKFLYKPILKVLADRKKKIEEGLSYSDKMKSEFEKSEKKRDEILVRARSDGKTIIEEAKRAAKKREEELLEKAQREAQEIIAKGSTKSSMRLRNGLQMDLRVVSEKEFGSALLYFIGNKEHNIELRKLALSKGYTLNEYGLFKVKDKNNQFK